MALMDLTSRYAPSQAFFLWTVLTMRPESERLDLYHHYARQLLDVRTLSFIVFLSLTTTTRIRRVAMRTDAFAVQTAWHRRVNVSHEPG